MKEEVQKSMKNVLAQKSEICVLQSVSASYYYPEVVGFSKVTFFGITYKCHKVIVVL